VENELQQAALTACRAGDFASARPSALGAFLFAPGSADATRLLGMIEDLLGRPDLAVVRLSRAARLDPGELRNHLALGDALSALGWGREAERAYRLAMTIEPGRPEPLVNAGASAVKSGDPAGALRRYARAVRINPTLADVHRNIAHIFREAGRLGDAAAAYERSLRLDPESVDARHGMGDVMYAACRGEEAAAWWRSALQRRPDRADTLNNLGGLLHDMNRLGEAARLFRLALVSDPAMTPAWRNLGLAAAAANETETARPALVRAAILDPTDLANRLPRRLVELAVIHVDEAEIDRRRAAYASEVEALRTDLAAGRLKVKSPGDVAADQAFFLPYQGRDDRELQARFGEVASSVAAAVSPPFVRPVRAAGGKIRVGILSGFFHEHTVWHLSINGWLKRLNRERFELIGWHTGPITDDLTQTAASSLDTFRHGRYPLDRWRDIVRGDRPDVILWPEVGIDPVSSRLAAFRLAPVQATTWGHPETTGLPTMDAFLTSDLMEPPDGEAHWTERLIRMPNLGLWYEPLPVPPTVLSRADLGLGEGDVVFWSAQSLYKYLPRFDDLFARIAERVGERARFVFIDFARSPRVNTIFRERLAHVFSARGLDATRYCVHLPSMPRDRYLDALRLADVVLDTPEWSGGRTTLETLPLAKPIVTTPGRFMRGRHTAAILERIGVGETIASSVDEYVTRAVEYGTDPSRRTRVSERIAAGRERAWRDEAFVAALEAFLIRAAS